MKKCSNCNLDFPDHLVTPMAVGDNDGLKYIDLCGICALEVTNHIHGIKRKTFGGEMAESLRQEAIAYNKKRK